MYLLLIPDFCNLCWNISAERFAFSTFQVWESHLYNRGSISYVLFQLRIWPHGPNSLQYFRISLGNNPPHQRCWKGIFVFESAAVPPRSFIPLVCSLGCIKKLARKVMLFWRIPVHKNPSYFAVSSRGALLGKYESKSKISACFQH